MRATQPTWLVLAVLALVGCASTDPADELVLVPRDAEAEPGAPARLVLLAHSELADPTVAGPVELWVPLPRSDAFQTVKSLAVEVGPPGTYDLQEQDGDRLLHVRAPGPTLVAVRAVIEQPRAAAPVPTALADLPAEDPAAWVEAARARGATARVVQALAIAPDGEVRASRAPEVLLDGAWAPVGVTDLVRLGPTPPHGAVDGKPVELRTRWAVQSPP